MSGKKRILVLTSAFPRKKSDWYNRYILNTYRFLPKEKYQITVLVPHSPRAKRKEKIDGIEVRRFPYFYPYSLQLLTRGAGALHSARGLLGKVQLLTYPLVQGLVFFDLLFRQRFDLIHVHWLLPQGFWGALGRLVFKIPLMVTVHGTDVFALEKINFLKRFILKNCDLCTVNSRATRKAVFSIYSKTKVFIVPMGVDLAVFNPKKKNNQWRQKFNRDQPILLAVGRLIRWKGFDYLLRAMPLILRNYPRARLAIVGSGPREQRLKNLAKKLRLTRKNLVFLGNLPHDKLSQIYASSDVLIAPSIIDEKTGMREAQGVVVIEALASGLPVVGSNSGGIKYIIDGKTTGLLSREKDAQDIARKVVRLLSDFQLRRLMVEKGLDLVRKNYDWKKIGNKFDKLYLDLV